MRAKTYAYIRVSTDKQEIDNQKFEILKFANEKKLGNVIFFEETVSGKKSWKNRKIAVLIEDMHEGDNLIVSELSRLGRSMLEIMELLSILLRKQVNVYVVKGGYELKDDIQSKVLTFAFSLAAELERELISQRTKEALKRKKAEGVKLGRPKGPGKSMLDPFEQEIAELMKRGVSINSLSKIYKCNYYTMYNFLCKRGLWERRKNEEIIKNANKKKDKK